MLEIEGVSIRFGDNPEAVSDTTFTVGPWYLANMVFASGLLTRNRARARFSCRESLSKLFR